MTRTVERTIDLLATVVLLSFAYMLKDAQPGLAGAVVMASISFWLNKNATAPDSPAHKEAAAAIEAAAILATSTSAAAAQLIKTAAQVAADAKDNMDKRAIVPGGQGR